MDECLSRKTSGSVIVNNNSWSGRNEGKHLHFLNFLALIHFCCFDNKHLVLLLFINK